jgi:hypothetical protein
VDGDGIIKLINSIIKFKTGLESMTLLESYQKYNCVLGISVTNITNNKLEVLTYKTDPDLSIAEAVAMSCSIPLLFTPYSYKNNLYIDGDTVECKNNPRYFKEIYDIDSLINERYNNMLLEMNNNHSECDINSQNDDINSQNDDVNSQNGDDNSQNGDVNSQNDDVNSQNDDNNTINDTTYDFLKKHESSIKKTIENEILEDIYSKTITIYLKKEPKKYYGDNFKDCTLMEYMSIILNVLGLGNDVKYNYDNSVIFIYLPNQLGNFMNFNIENEDILNSIDIGYNLLKQIIKSENN